MAQAKDKNAAKEASKDSYLVPDLKPGQYHVNEIVIKRSRFITTIAHTASVDEAKAFIEEISLQYKDARHNCFAFNATAPNSTAYCGCSDDGEPKGTAGLPMLDVVLHCYFGGVLLGTGGLVKAYQGSVQEALMTLPTTERMIAAKLSLGIEHRYIPKFQYLLPRYRATVVKENYAEVAYFDVVLPLHEADNLERELIDLTKGSLKIIAKS